MAVQIQFRRGTATEWTTANPVLAQGEIGLELDSGKIKAGDGVLAWNALPYVTGTQGPQGIQGEQGLQGAQGDAGPQGIQGIQGPPGADGVGIPSGGTAGQYLRKASGTNYDTAWSALLDADIPSSITRDSEAAAAYAPIAKGVTGGDAHDHSGGDGAQISHTNLSNIGTNAHSAIDTFIASKGAASGLASLDSGTKVLVAQLPTFTSSTAGVVPSSGGGTTNFIRADGTWAAPPTGGISDGDKGDITVSGSGATWTIDAAAVTFAKIQNVTDVRLLGRSAGSAGAPQEITVGSGLSLAAGALTATGGGATIGYVLNLAAASLSTITDAATYFFGCLAGLAPQTTVDLAPIYITKAGTIKAAEVWMRSGTAGTAESISVNIRKNNSADTLIASLGAATATRRFSNTALALAVALGDRIEIKVVCPTWATNPATVAFGGNIYVE